MTAMSTPCPPELRAALTGPCPSIHTPFTLDGAIDFAALRREVDFDIQAGAKSLILTWGDSLFSVLTEAEIAEVTKVVVEQARGRAKVVAADGSWWTGKAVEFARYCRQVGADLLMVRPPDWAGSTTVETLVAHFSAVAEQIPVMLVTGFLGARGQGFALQAVKALYERVPGVVAAKDDMCGEFARRLCLMTHERWALIAGGQKQNHINMLPCGVDGYFSLFLSFKPEIAWRYWRAVQSGDLADARAVVRDYDMPLFDYLIASEGSFDAAIHGLFEVFGLMKRFRRPSYHTLTGEQMEKLRQFLKVKGIL